MYRARIALENYARPRVAFQFTHGDQIISLVGEWEKKKGKQKHKKTTATRRLNVQFVLRKLRQRNLSRYSYHKLHSHANDGVHQSSHSLLPPVWWAEENCVIKNSAVVCCCCNCTAKRARRAAEKNRNQNRKCDSLSISFNSHKSSYNLWRICSALL